MKNNIFKTLFLILIGIIIGILLITSLLFFSITKFTRRPLTVKNNSWLVLDFAGPISEKPLSRMPSIFSSSVKKIQLIDYLNAIEHAANDDRINGILINGDLTFYSRVHTEEIQKSLDKFRISGKEIIAWFSTGIDANYYLCIAADKIYMPDTDSATLTLTGYSYSMPYLKDGLDKLGINFNVIHIGNYKVSAENYARNTISDELKESNISLLENLYIYKINEINKRRNLDLNAIDKIIRQNRTILMTPQEAKEYGFIDAKKSYRELTESLEINKKFNNISIYNYSEVEKKMNRKKRDKKIAIIYIEGLITNYFNDESNIYGDSIGTMSLEKSIKTIKEDNNIKSVIIRVSSPGGSALASEQILQTIVDLKKEKPVYVSFGPIAASGGYYISCLADRIFTSPSTITGSIGVVSILFNINQDKFMKDYGINFETIKKNKYDDFLSPLREPSHEELNILEKSMRKTYEEFIKHVSEGRKINKEKMLSIAEGRTWTGLQSVENNLTDEIGGLLDAIDYAKKTNNLEECTIVSYPKPVDFLDKLMNLNQQMLNQTELSNKYYSKYVKNIINLYKLNIENGYKPLTLLPLYEIP